MTSTDDNGEHGIVIAADVGGYSLATLGLAAHMAASMKTRLHGLFVEDQDLLQLTGLPITREISLATASERPIDAARTQRSLRALAAQFEQSLKREAGTLQVGCSFAYVRGRMHDIGLQSGVGRACTILDRGVSARTRAKAAAAPARILWLSRDARREAPTMQVILERFHHRPVELVTVHADDNKPGAIAAAATGGNIRLQRWPDETLPERIGRGAGFDLAVLSRQAAARRLGAILKSLTCPVILVD